MKVSINWLRELLPGLDGAGIDQGALAARLTACGIEVEGMASVGGFTGVVVAEVRACRRHEQADKLSLVDVFDGQTVTQVVCGAQNIPAPGGKVAWARPGARLPDGQGGVRVLEARAVRGVLSPGMLCAEDELGLSESHAGLLLLDDDAVPGADVAETLGLPDTILELNVTPNRPDCMGHLGVAREITAAFAADGVQLSVQLPESELGPFAIDEPAAWSGEGLPAPRVTIEDPEGCARYIARVLDGVEVRPSRLRVRLRLQALGVRAINNIVDATNLVLLESGHPLHAFDLGRLAGGRIVVRRARPGETLRTLDGQERTLGPDDVTICDAERPVAVAGVMGGADSEVHEGTTAILLESAWFEPARVRRTSRRLGLRSEASQRFERGADPNGALAWSSARCARLIAEWAGQGGSARPISGAAAFDAYPRRIEPAVVALRPARVSAVLGLEVAADEQERLLGRLGLVPGEGGYRVPTYRPDLTREIDLVEEVGRLIGLDRVPATLPALRRAPRPGVDPRTEAARDALVACGLTEIISFSFVPPDDNPPLRALDDRALALRLENPLGEDRSALRLSLLPGLLRAAGRNLSRGVGELRLFEVGTAFLPRQGREVAARMGWPARGRDELLPEERRRVAGLLLGRREAHLKDGGAYDFFDGKGVVEALLGGLRVEGAAFRRPAAGDDQGAGEAALLHPGRSAVLSIGPHAAGVVGELHPDARQRLESLTRVDLGGVILFEVDLDRLGAPAPPRAAEMARFPASSRDLSFFVDREVPAAELSSAMAEVSPLIESVRPLDDYREPGRVPDDKKGMLFALQYRASDRTLTDEEVGRAHATVVEALVARYRIEPR